MNRGHRNGDESRMLPGTIGPGPQGRLGMSVVPMERECVPEMMRSSRQC